MCRHYSDAQAGVEARPDNLAGTNESRRRIPQPCAGTHETDVAIVGGGMTGAMIAEAFTRARRPVAVLEAARVGHGSTAASTALLLQEPDYDLAALTRALRPARREAHLALEPGCRARFH